MGSRGRAGMRRRSPKARPPSPVSNPLPGPRPARASRPTAGLCCSTSRAAACTVRVRARAHVGIGGAAALGACACAAQHSELAGPRVGGGAQRAQAAGRRHPADATPSPLPPGSRSRVPLRHQRPQEELPPLLRRKALKAAAMRAAAPRQPALAGCPVPGATDFSPPASPSWLSYSAPLTSKRDSRAGCRTQCAT